VFLKEAGLPSDTGQVSKDALTIEKVLSEKKLYDLSVRFEKLGQDESVKWGRPGKCSVVGATRRLEDA
jgi:hypothetical protein